MKLWGQLRTNRLKYFIIILLEMAKLLSLHPIREYPSNPRPRFPVFLCAANNLC